MPLTLAAAGEENIIRKVGGNPEAKKHLEELGFVTPRCSATSMERTYPCCSFIISMASR